MRRRSSLLLSVLLVLGLIAPGAMVAAPYSAGTTPARLAAPAVDSAATGGPSRASSQSNRNHGPKKDRTQKNQKDRKPNRKTKDRKRNGGGSGADHHGSSKDQYIVVLKPSRA